jgi:hypothetical protein
MIDDEKLIRAKDATRYDIVGMPTDRFELMSPASSGWSSRVPSLVPSSAGVLK